MKFYYVVFLLIGCLPGIAQEQKIEFTGVAQTDSATTRDALYSKALRWIAENYNSAKTVIQSQDKEAGSIVVKAGFPYLQVVPLSKFDAFMNYTLTLDFKDGRYKYAFTNFYPECANIDYPYMTKAAEPNKQFRDAFGKKGWTKTKEIITEKMNNMVASLTEYMKKGGASDW